MKILFILLLLINFRSFADYSYNFDVNFDSLTDATHIPLAIFSNSIVRSTIYSISGNQDSVAEFKNQKITQLLFKTFEVKFTKNSNAILMDGHKWTNTEYTASNSATTLFSFSDCAELKSSIELKTLNLNNYLVKKTYSGCNKNLIIIYSYNFFKLNKSKPIIKNKNYLFLTDPVYNQPLHWKTKEINLSIAGDEDFFLAATEALKPYQDLLSKKINLKLNKKDTCDWINISEHCLFMYASTNKKIDTSIHFAATHVLANPQTGEILDIDIGFRSNDFNKWKSDLRVMIDAQITKNPQAKEKLEVYFKNKATQYLLNIITHEFGHALGLAHNFSNKNPSIMGYNQLTQLSHYDQEALNELYLFKPKVSKVKFDLQIEVINEKN